MGSELQEEPAPFPSFPTRESVQRFFSTFLFFVSKGWLGEQVGWEAAGSVSTSSPPLMLSQCFLSLSLELVLRHLTLRAGLSHVGGPAERRQAVQPEPTRSRAPANQPHPLPLHRLLLPSPWGLSVWGEGSCLETVPHPWPPTPEIPAPPHHSQTSHHTALRTSRSSRDHAGRAASSHSSCIKLSPCPFLPLPQCFF